MATLRGAKKRMRSGGEFSELMKGTETTCTVRAADEEAGFYTRLLRADFDAQASSAGRINVHA
ncbi:MAG: hypothetical protein ACXWIM_21365, partial [Burkholderiales bacterium]